MTVMIDAEYVLKIIGDQLYGEMSAGDEYLYDHKTYDDGLEWCFELIRNVANNTAPGLHAGGAGTMNWISVKDRLPEDSGQVLAYGAGEIFMAYFDADFHDGAWFKYFLNDECQDPYLDPYYGEIRCWMPLPEPPEVEDGNGE